MKNQIKWLLLRTLFVAVDWKITVMAFRLLVPNPEQLQQRIKLLRVDHHWRRAILSRFPGCRTLEEVAAKLHLPLDSPDGLPLRLRILAALWSGP